MPAPTIQKPIKQKVEPPPQKAPREKARGISTWRRWLKPTLVAIGVFVALVAIGMLVATLMSPDTGNVVPNDTGIMHANMVNPDTGFAIPKAEASWVTLYDTEGNVHQVHVRTGAEDVWVTLYDAEGNAHQVHAH